MVLRGCSHLHYISVIKSGIVIEMPNISPEKKQLKLKDVGEIYATDSTYDISATRPSKVGRNLATYTRCDEIKVEINFTEESSEPDLDGLTLKQLKNTCKSKKRKRSKSFNFVPVKQEVIDTQHEEDSELNETLCSLKHKLFKERETKRNGTTDSSSLSSESSSASEATEEVSGDLVLHETENQGFKHVMIKTEEAELDYVQPPVITCIVSDDPDEMSCEMHGTIGPCPKQAINRRLEDLQSSSLNGTSWKLVEHNTPIVVEPQGSDFNVVSHECEENQNWSPSQVPYEHQEYIQLQSPVISEGSKIEDKMLLGSNTILDNQSPILPVAEQTEIEGMTDLTASVEAFEPVSDTQQVSPCMEPVKVQVPSTYPLNNCQNAEIIDSEKSSGSIINENEEAEIIEWNVDQYSSAVTSGSCPAIDGAPRIALTSAVVDELSTSDLTVASPACSPASQPCEAIGKATFSAQSEDSQIAESVYVHSPERLLSTRKTISPNSQQKLCKALKTVDLQKDTDTNHIKGHQTASKRTEALSSAEMTSNPRQARKGKEVRKIYASKGITKGVHASHTSQSAAHGCSSVHSTAQNAIQFSQQQMHDIERLGTKLVSELQSMKDIVVDVLHSESRACAKKYKPDDVRVAVENASKVEETTRKWLSIMTRDCNRFCKIMKITEANAVPPETPSEKTVHNGRKKIVFADEAGGTLCQVRVFETLESGLDKALSGESQIEERMLGA